MNTKLDPRWPIPYKIEVKGEVNAKWLMPYGPMHVTSHPDHTAIVARVDQATLRGILNHLWDLNVFLCSVSTADVASEPQRGGDHG